MGVKVYRVVKGKLKPATATSLVGAQGRFKKRSKCGKKKGCGRKTKRSK